MKVRVQNYQTSLDTSFEVKGFTVVVGKSNTGKTGLLRAVEGAMFNDPVTGRVREGEKETIVSIEFDDIQWTWTKGDKPPKYEVTTDKGFQEYSSLGRNVPQELVDAGFWEWRSEDLRARPQIAAWYEPIFLLDKTPKVITELLATVTRLDVVNLSIRKCSLYIRRKRSKLGTREEDLQAAEAREREFDQMDAIDMPDLEAAHKAWTDAQEGIKQVAEYQTRLQNLNNRLGEFEVLDKVKLPKALPTDTLKNVNQLAKWERAYVQASLVLEQMDVLDEVVIPAVDLKEDADKLTALDAYIAKLQKVDEDISKLDKAETVLVTQINADVEHLDALRGSIEECPVCGRDA